MNAKVCVVLCCVALFLAGRIALADGACAKCKEKIESPRWNFCPYCGEKLDKAGAAAAPAGAPAAAPDPRDQYEVVSWDKIVFEKYKYHEKKVRFSARYMGIQQYYAPAEIMGITSANFINVCLQGNRTNYLDRKKVELAEKLKRIAPFTTVVVYATIKVKKDTYGMGQDVYIVLIDDMDVE